MFPSDLKFCLESLICYWYMISALINFISSCWKFSRNSNYCNQSNMPPGLLICIQIFTLIHFHRWKCCMPFKKWTKKFQENLRSNSRLMFHSLKEFIYETLFFYSPKPFSMGTTIIEIIWNRSVECRCYRAMKKTFKK